MDSQQTEQFCIVIVSPKIFSSKVDIEVDFGQETSAANYSLKEEIQTVKEMPSIVDALNYMSKRGWQMVNGYSIVNSKSGVNEQHYLMKKMAR
jgi:hypothetical protein